MPERKHIFKKSDRRWPPSKIPREDTPETTAEAFACDHTRHCEVCGQTPVVNATGLCGPCTFGEADTAGGNW